MRPPSAWRGRALAIVVALIVLALWELLPRIGAVDPFFTSSPSRIANAAEWLFAHGFWNDIRVSLAEYFWGMLLAIVFGVLLGWGIGWNRTLGAILEPYVTVLNAAPRVALFPLLFIADLWLILMQGAGALAAEIRTLDATGDYAIALEEFGDPGGIFEIAWYMRGMEQFMLDMIEQPDLVYEIMRRVTDFYIGMAERVLTAATTALRSSRTNASSPSSSAAIFTTTSISAAPSATRCAASSAFDSVIE